MKELFGAGAVAAWSNPTLAAPPTPAEDLALSDVILKDALGGVEAAAAFEADRKPFVPLPFAGSAVPRDPMNEPLVRASNVDGASFASDGALD